MALDARPGGPAKYRQIADDLRHQVTSGHLSPGSQLPTAEELGERYDATRPTIQAALRLLRAAGLVSTSSGRPATVRPRPPVTRVPRPTPQEWATTADHEHVEQVGYVPAPDHIAHQLLVDPGARVFARRSRFTTHQTNQPVRVETTYLPPSSARGARLFLPEPLHLPAHLEHETGIRAASGRTLSGARMPTPEEAAALTLPDGVPLLYVLVIEYDDHNQPLYVTELGWPADRYELADDYPSTDYRRAATTSNTTAQPEPAHAEAPPTRGETEDASTVGSRRG